MQFLFINSTDTVKTQREKELSYAEAQAHIARRAHALRREKSVNLKNDSHGLRKSPSKAYGSDTIRSEQRIQSAQLIINNAPIQSHFGGSSDPFDCQLIRVTARINQAVCFVRFYLNKCWSPSFILRLVNSHFSHRFEEDHISSAGSSAAKWLWNVFNSNQGIFWSAVASILPLMKRAVSTGKAVELNKVSLQLKVKSMKYLQEEFRRTEGSRVSLSMIYHVKALFRESSMNGDIEDARIHAKMLTWLVTKSFEEVNESELLRIALWSDAIPALLHLRRPLFKYNTWMPHMTEKIWNSPEVEALQDYNAGELPKSILDPQLRDAFRFTRQILHLNDQVLNMRQSSVEQVFQWIRTKVEYHMCCLLEMYFDLMEGHDRQSTPGERYTTVALSLSLLYILQKSFCDATRSDGFDFHESAAVIYPALREVVQRIQLECSRTEEVFYQETHFWILFVGAYCEQRLLAEQKTFNNKSCVDIWFHQRMIMKGQQLGLVTWHDAKSILKRWVFNDFLAPNPEHWYRINIG